jgi:predicted amidohydrolase
MRIALLQTAGDPANEPAANLDRLAEAAKRAKAGGADLLVAPEMFLTGYAIGREAAEQKAEPADGPSARRAGEIAQANGIAIAYGYPERGDDGSVYNAAILIDAGGRRLLNYRKAHLFAALDRSMFAVGTGTYETARLGPFTVGMLICYDVEFPEAARALALAGADLILVPTANMQPYQPVSHLLVPARAYENGIYVAYANRCGREAELDYYGLSSVAGPAGGNLVMAGESEELIFTDIDIGEVSAARTVNTHLKDRRPEAYRALAQVLG